MSRTVNFPQKPHYLYMKDKVMSLYTWRITRYMWQWFYIPKRVLTENCLAHYRRRGESEVHPLLGWLLTKLYMSVALSGDCLLFCHHWPKAFFQYTENIDYAECFNKGAHKVFQHSIRCYLYKRYCLNLDWINPLVALE